MSSTRFICQQCSQPLKINQSKKAQDLNTPQEPATWTVASSLRASEIQEQGSTSFEGPDRENLQVGASWICSDDSWMFRDIRDNFTLLGKFDSMRSLNNILKIIRDIDDMVSSEKEIDHPLCVDCTDKFLEHLDTSLAITESENQSYRQCLESKERVVEDEQETLLKELKELELEEARLTQEFLEVEKKREKAATDLEAAKAETKILEQEELLYQREESHLRYQELELWDELRSLENQLCYTQSHLAQLEKTSIFNTSFQIWSEGSLGIINNFRLGCLPTVPVRWSEINAAWGQTALLLFALSKTIGLEFQRYQLVPCGDHSYLKSLTEDAIELPLFCSGDQGFPMHTKFDKAMVAFLDCMHQFKEEAGKGKLNLCLPYKIHVKEGLMEDPGVLRKFYSIRTCWNTKEEWTKALMLLLVNFKWTLAWVSSRYSQR
ncbi:beclin-2 [Erinaceus europaeus]|uniref:Beclin-2 n=1 Tax=Erinaceus europaeus TaxID=9365 RepID=A0A1S3AIQ2_ERIEU|nr:beclin-2 [Erinaceus europaeus]